MLDQGSRLTVLYLSDQRSHWVHRYVDTIIRDEAKKMRLKVLRDQTPQLRCLLNSTTYTMATILNPNYSTPYHRTKFTGSHQSNEIIVVLNPSRFSLPEMPVRTHRSLSAKLLLPTEVCSKFSIIFIRCHRCVQQGWGLSTHKCRGSQQSLREVF